MDGGVSAERSVMINLVVMLSTIGPLVDLWMSAWRLPRLSSDAERVTLTSRSLSERKQTLARTIMSAISAYAIFLCADFAAAERFLTPPQMIFVLTDGSPWIMNTPDGMQARLTLHKDGTGVFEGPFTGPSAWTLSGEEICMIIKMPVPVTNRKCFRVANRPGGYQAYENGTPVFTLTR